ncbi:MAG: MbcA/ParS/Xre antitoxin family protein [Arenimonas sp.]
MKDSIDASSSEQFILAEAEKIFEGRANAIQWFNTPLVIFNGKTPAELVKVGRSADIVDYLQSISAGFVG